MKDQPFTILGINSDPAENYRKAVKENDISWPSFWDGGNTRGPIATRWAVQGWPTIYVLDSKGVIRFTNVRGESLDKAVDELMAEMEKSS